MRARTLSIIIALLIVFAAVFLFRYLHNEPPPLTTTADKLQSTIVTPHLEQEIVSGKNALWCSTFQLAWNELYDQVGGPVMVKPASQTAEILNKRTATKADVDDASYVAMAGRLDDGLEHKIRDELQRKFGGKSTPELLGDIKQGLGWATYAYFSKNLPFRHPFRRHHDNLQFQGKMVDSFGITDLDRKDKMLPFQTEQVEVPYYKPGTGSGGAEYIVELRTRVYDDSLLLAMVKPKRTLAETVLEVMARSSTETYSHLSEKDTLQVPVLNFDVTRDYQELLGRTVESELVKTGVPLAAARQLIRFKLDERGASLASEAGLLGMAGEPPDYVPKRLIFNQPFLILLKRKDAKNPYFALWVDNPELLVSTKVPPGI